MAEGTKHQNLNENRSYLIVTFTDFDITVSDTAPTETVGDGYKHRISFVETCDYLNNKIPTRGLKMSISKIDLTKLINSNHFNSENNKNLFNINIKFLMTADFTQTTNKILPLLESNFKGRLKTTDGRRAFANAPENKFDLHDNDPEHKMEDVVFTLHTQEELTFGTGLVNHYFTQTTLENVFTYLFETYNPKLRWIKSKFDHNPLVDMLISPMDYRSAVSLLELEYRFFRTKVIEFTDKDIYYLLNTDNNVNVTCAKMSNELNVNKITEIDNTEGRLHNTFSLDGMNIATTLYDDSIHISNDTSNLISQSPILLYPDGTSHIPTIDELSSGITTDTIRKLTMVPRLSSLQDAVYEVITFKTPNIPYRLLNPLTTIIYKDGNDAFIKYRLCYKSIKTHTLEGQIITIKGFRIKMKGVM